MRCNVVTPHLVKLTRLGMVNVFLVVEEDGVTVVDTGLSGSADGIIAAADRRGKPIRRIALTHGHDDHAGSLDALHQALPDVPVLVGAREARFLAGDRSIDPGEPPLRGSVVKRRATAPTDLLSPGDRVGSLEVVAAPGHTVGQIAFLDRRDQTLLAGDAWVTLGRLATSGRPRLPFPLPAWSSWHRPTALRTARALRELEPARLAVGHGPVVDDPGPAMDRVLTAIGV